MIRIRILAPQPQPFHLYTCLMFGVARRAQEKDPRTVIRMPIELLSWAGGEPVTGGGPELTSEVIRKACQPPAQRFDTINKITGTKRPTMEVGLDRQLVEVTGRTLEPMELIYYDHVARRPKSVHVEADKVAPAASARVCCLGARSCTRTRRSFCKWFAQSPAVGRARGTSAARGGRI